MQRNLNKTLLRRQTSVGGNAPTTVNAGRLPGRPPGTLGRIIPHIILDTDNRARNSNFRIHLYFCRSSSSPCRPFTKFYSYLTVQHSCRLISTTAGPESYFCRCSFQRRLPQGAFVCYACRIAHMDISLRQCSLGGLSLPRAVATFVYPT